MNRKIPKVSVGIPVYNGEQCLEGALESLARQDMNDVEFIICDNGSTDQTPDICRRWAEKDNRFRVYAYPRNDGAARNFWRAFEFSLSPYFMWAACDDRWDPSYIRRCAEVLDARPDAALAYSYTHFVDNQGRQISEIVDPFDLTHDSPTERFKNIVGRLGWCNIFYGLFRTDCLTRCNHLNWRFHGSDALFIMEILFYGKIFQIPEFLFYRNMNHMLIEPGERKKDFRKNFENHFLRKGSGVTLPYFDYVYQHLHIIQTASIPPEDKPDLIRRTLETMFYGSHQKYMIEETDRLISLVKQNRFNEEWDMERTERCSAPAWKRQVQPLHIVKILKYSEELLLIYPNMKGLYLMRSICLACLGRFHEAKAALAEEKERHPQNPDIRIMEAKLNSASQ